MFDVSLQTDELGETSTTLATHKVFSLLVNGLDMQFEAMRAHNGFGTVRTWDLHVLLVMASVKLQLVNLFLMAHKGPKGLKCRSTTITKFWLLPFLLAFRRRGFSLGLSHRLVNRSFSMKDSDMTLE